MILVVLEQNVVRIVRDASKAIKKKDGFRRSKSLSNPLQW